MFKAEVVSRIDGFYPENANLLFNTFGHADVRFSVKPADWDRFVAHIEADESDFYEESYLLFVNYFTEWFNENVLDEEN